MSRSIIRQICRSLISPVVVLSAICALAEPPPAPAVLFHGGLHSSYVVAPLHEAGIQVDRCETGELAQKLATGSYNVVVSGILSDADRQALDAFVAAGGGAMICNPTSYPRTEDFTKTCEWLKGLGATPRWELMQDSDAQNCVKDVMGCQLSWSDTVLPPVDKGVAGVLTLTGHSSTGWEPPMSFTLSEDWRVAVRGAPTMTTLKEKRNDLHLKPWQDTPEALEAPPLLALRQVGKGRMAVLAIRYYWLFSPPSNCPTTEVMLSKGTGNRPSAWLTVCANTFRWLAEPSRAAGKGGAITPAELLDPPVEVWEPPKVIDWANTAPIGPDQPQHQGLIGARTALSNGTGSVADYVAAAKQAELQFIVFLEDWMHMTSTDWEQLVAECKKASDKTFLAVPGFTYEDAQGNHLYAFADQANCPTEDMLLPDRRLATTQPMRSRAYFDLINERMQQKCISGFWRHADNFLPPVDYKLYNSFPIMSFEDGKPVDSALDDFLYLQGVGGCQAALALEIMTTPDMVAKRATEGWRVVAHRDLETLDGNWHRGAFSFSGSGSQYITNGPRILVWDSPNRLISPSGLWWRPDQWEMRLRIRVASDNGLKTVTVHDGDRRIIRRWLPAGENQFEADLVLSNDQQTGYTLIVEDMKGKRAISMSFWNRNCIMEEFFCSDRCNSLGNSRLRTRQGQQVWTQVSFQANMGITPSKGRLNLLAHPAVNLTRNSPTLPIDGAPAGFPTVALNLNPRVPGELPVLYAYPQTYLVSAEIAVGQADIKLAYDPAEKDAEKSPLGHAYEQPQHGWGNAWGGWHRLIPTRVVEGWSRIYACNWLPGNFRLGWQETRLTCKQPVTDAPGVTVLTTGGGNWLLHTPDQAPTPHDQRDLDGPFTRGTFFTREDAGGCVVLFARDDGLTYRFHPDGAISLFKPLPEGGLAAGDTIHYQIGWAGASAGTTAHEMLRFAQIYGIARPGEPDYNMDLKSGKQIDALALLRVDGQGRGIHATFPRTDIPGFLPVAAENLHDNWSVQLVDYAREWPNHRALPIRDGRAFAQLDLQLADSDIFIGHPVVADQPEVTLQVAWQEPGIWYVEAHNPGDQRLAAKLSTNPDWKLFAFAADVDLAPGASRTWRVATAQHSLGSTGERPDGR